MTKSGAERQAAYRKSRRCAGPNKDGEFRIDTYVASAAFFALKRLARHRGLSYGRVMEGLLLAADNVTG